MLGDPKVWKQLGDKKAYVEGGSGSVMLGCVIMCSLVKIGIM